MISATPIDMDMIVAVVGLCFGTRDRTQMVSTVAGDRSGGQESGHVPVHVTLLGVDRGASRFRNGGVKQVGSHRRKRVNAEKQYQQRRHQRTATHAGQTHDGADDKTGERIEPVHGRYNSALVHSLGHDTRFWRPCFYVGWRPQRIRAGKRDLLLSVGSAWLTVMCDAGSHTAMGGPLRS